MEKNLLGEFIVLLVFAGIFFLFIASMSGEPEQIRDTYDGSNRLVYP